MNATSRATETTLIICNDCAKPIPSCKGCGEAFRGGDHIECYNFGGAHYCKEWSEDDD
ncbi:MAG: hypothetical protein KAJ03_01190 [Gammaproteobacteria bacterium]|nr:hypothetical protein [Gammaproteobacteria bacterium]